jgi:hypothetical protein
MTVKVQRKPFRRCTEQDTVKQVADPPKPLVARLPCPVCDGVADARGDTSVFSCDGCGYVQRTTRRVLERAVAKVSEERLKILAGLQAGTVSGRAQISRMAPVTKAEGTMADG